MATSSKTCILPTEAYLIIKDLVDRSIDQYTPTQKKAIEAYRALTIRYRQSGGPDIQEDAHLTRVVLLFSAAFFNSKLDGVRAYQRTRRQILDLANVQSGCIWEATCYPGGGEIQILVNGQDNTGDDRHGCRVKNTQDTLLHECIHESASMRTSAGSVVAASVDQSNASRAGMLVLHRAMNTVVLGGMLRHYLRGSLQGRCSITNRSSFQLAYVRR
jgi:hypothetical protein